VLNPVDHPFLVIVGTLLAFWLAARLGALLRVRGQALEEEQDFRFVLGGTLTLLGLIVGFTFSMAVSRYDQRKRAEEQEANAISTAYFRAELLPAADAEKVRALLRAYLDQRVLFYTTRDEGRVQEIDGRTLRLQRELWSVVAGHASAQPTPVAAQVTAGVNGVLDAHGVTHAAWSNRIPGAAWALLLSMATFCNLLIGYGAHGRRSLSIAILPIVLSVTLFFLADIESPRGGLIVVRPRNLESVAEVMRPG
jgi:hypothetical protein